MIQIAVMGTSPNVYWNPFPPPTPWNPSAGGVHCRMLGPNFKFRQTKHFPSSRHVMATLTFSHIQKNVSSCDEMMSPPPASKSTSTSPSTTTEASENHQASHTFNTQRRCTYYSSSFVSRSSFSVLLLL